MNTDKAYVQGLEDMYNTIKAIFEMSHEARSEKFGSPYVASIMNEHDFVEVFEEMNNPIKVKYIIRGIKVNDYNQKRVVVESGQLDFKPDEVLVNAFLNCHKDKGVSFATIEEIYVREDK